MSFCVAILAKAALVVGLFGCMPSVASEQAENALFAPSDDGPPEPDTTGYTQWQTVARSPSHTMGIRSDGTLWGWGANNGGQLGLGNTAPHSTPFQVGSANSWVSVTVGQCCTGVAYTIARQIDGSVWTWGGNANGELGQGTSDGGGHSTPIQVSFGGTPVVSVSTGATSSIALGNDGTVYTWGRGNVNQLPQGASTGSCASGMPCSMLPEAVPALADAQIVIMTDMTGFARLSDDSLVGWGFNDHGAIGYGSNGQTAIISADLPGGRIMVQGSVSAHALMVADDGTLWSAGYNQYGQLGRDDTLSDRYDWGQVGTDTDWMEVAALGIHSLALKTNGTLWSWGDNSAGQLGWTPPATYCGGTCYPFPHRIGAASNWGKLVAGSSPAQSGALKTNGVLFAWGSNDVGQQGDGSIGGVISIPTPVP